MRRVTARVPDEIFLKLTVLATVLKKSKEEIVVEALQEYLKRREEEARGSDEELKELGSLFECDP